MALAGIDLRAAPRGGPQGGGDLGDALFPLAFQLDGSYPFFPQELLAAHCRENGIPRLDLLPAFRKHSKEDLFVLGKEGRDDIWHLTDAGHKLSAGEIHRFLQEHGLLPANR